MHPWEEGKRLKRTATMLGTKEMAARMKNDRLVAPASCVKVMVA